MAISNDLNISQSGIVVFDGQATFTGVTLTAGSGISISNGSGVAGNPVISATATGTLSTLTGNSGGAISPTAGNINTVGTGSITIAGAGSILTTQLTGLTNHAVLVGAGTATITNIAATANTGAILQNNSGADPSYSTATYPATTTVSQILYSSSTNTVAGLATANRGVLTTGATGIPVITALATDGQLIIGSTAGAPAAATLTAGTGVSISNGSNSITIATASAVALSFPTDSGTATPSSGALTVHGGSNINTSGASATVTINLNSQILQPDGSLSAPSYSFTNSTNTGMSFENATSKISIVSAGSRIFSAEPTFGQTTLTASNQLQLSAGGFVTTFSEFKFQASIDYTYAAPSSWPYTVNSVNDYYISVDSSAARTVSLPNAPATGKTFIIKDRVGSAATNNITVTTVGGSVTIDGATSYLITINFGAAQFIFNGSAYEVF